MKENKLVRIWAVLLALVGLALMPRPAAAWEKIGLPGVTDVSTLEVAYPDGAWLPLGRFLEQDWQIAFFSPDQVLPYLKGIVADHGKAVDLAIHTFVISGGFNALQAALAGKGAAATGASYVGVIATTLEEAALTTELMVINIEAATDIAAVTRNGIVGILHVNGIPILGAPFILDRALVPASLIQPLFSLSTTKGCGGFFNSDEPVLIQLQSPLDCSATLTIEPRDGGAKHTLVTGLPLTTDQPSIYGIPAHQYSNGPWKLQVQATTLEGLHLREQICNFTIQDPPPPGPYTFTPPSPSTGTGNSSGGTTGKLIQLFETAKGPGEHVYHRWGGINLYGGEQVRLLLRVSRRSTVTKLQESGPAGTIDLDPLPGQVVPGGDNLIGFGDSDADTGLRTFTVTASDGKAAETASLSVVWVNDPTWLPAPKILVSFTSEGAQVSWNRPTNPEVQSVRVLARNGPSQAAVDDFTSNVGVRGGWNVLDTLLPASQSSLFVPLSPDSSGTWYRFEVDEYTEEGFAVSFVDVLRPDYSGSAFGDTGSGTGG